MAVARLDYVVLTHFHVDHIGGIDDVGARIPIATVIDRGHDYLPPPDDDPAFRALPRVPSGAGAPAG